MPESIAVPDNETVTSQVMVLARRLQGDYLHKIRNTGLTPSQARVLRELALSPGIAQQALAQRLEIGKVSVGEALAKLDQAGLVHRERRADNRRFLRVTLTAAGEDILRLLAIAAQDQIDLLEAKLGSARIATLNGLLLEINAAMTGSWTVSTIE